MSAVGKHNTPSLSSQFSILKKCQAKFDCQSLSIKLLNCQSLSKSFTVVIQHLSTRLIKPNFCFDLPHRRSTTVSLETRNP